MSDTFDQRMHTVMAQAKTGHRLFVDVEGAPRSARVEVDPNRLILELHNDMPDHVEALDDAGEGWVVTIEPTPRRCIDCEARYTPPADDPFVPHCPKHVADCEECRP